MSDIKVVKLKKTPLVGFDESQLVLELSGSKINYAVVNTLRRLLIDEIPTYAFCGQTITIEENTSVFDNDEMRMNLEGVPIFNHDPKITDLPEKYWKNVDYSDPNREKHPEDNKLIEIYINAENDTNDYMNVMSKDCKFYIDGEESKDWFDSKYPALFIQLRPGDTFKCRMKGVLGVGLRSNIWSTVSTCFMEEINPNDVEEPHKYKLTVESQGQIDELQALVYACQIYKNKLNNTMDALKNNYSKQVRADDRMVEIVLKNESHTLGNLLAYTIEEQKDIYFSGYNKVDQNINDVTLKVAAEKSNPLEGFYSAIKYLVKLFDDLEKKFEKLK